MARINPDERLWDIDYYAPQDLFDVMNQQTESTQTTQTDNSKCDLPLIGRFQMGK
jgi:hypothetical protein